MARRPERVCEADRRMTVSALRDIMQLEKVWSYAHRVLKENQRSVLAIADRIEKDGSYFP
jgi:hypothetical protein